MDTWGNVMKPIYIQAQWTQNCISEALKEPKRYTWGCWKCMRGTLDDIPVVVRTNQGMASAADSTCG